LQTATVGVGLTVVTFVARRLFNQLHRFPGPKLAAITRFYTAYFDLIKYGSWVEQLENLHRKYGPVVRTGPNELHFSDPRAYAAIYNMTSKFHKDPYFYKAFGMDGCSICLTDLADARARRNVLGPLFSKKSIDQLEYLVQDKVDLLIQQLAKQKDPVNLFFALRSTSIDIISSYCFGQSYDALQHPEFRHPVLLGVDATVPMHLFLRHFQFLIPFILNLPPWLNNMLSHDSRGFNEMRDRLEGRVDELLADPSALERAEHETIFHHLLQPQEVKSKTGSGTTMQVIPKQALLEECVNLMCAGSETVGNTCAVGIFHVLNDLRVLRRLDEELDEAWADINQPMGHAALSKLPFLTAVIKESLRLAHGLVTPLPRIVGPNAVDIAGIQVPAGTAVSIGATFVHLNPELFPDPHSFNPDRWLQPNAKELDNYLVAFSKGPQACVGINLAWCELYLIFANVFRKLSLELYGTRREDFEYYAAFAPLFKGKPLRATVTPRST
jgi:cytochrome P450